MTLRHALANALLQFLWQGAIIGLAAGIAVRALRSHSANGRYLVCVVALLLCVAMPGLTTWLLYTRGELWSNADSATLVARWVDTTVGWPNAMRTAWFNGVESWVLSAWVAGALLCSARLANAGRHVRGLGVSAAQAPPDIVATLARATARLGVTSTVRIALSRLVDGPSVIGWLRPLVLLPASLGSGLTPEQLETIIAHELAHVRRYDYLANLIQSVVEILLFFHPVVWWLSARARHERELCCDDVVLRYYDARATYARALVCLERLRLAAPSLALGALDRSLSFRVRRMLGVAHAAPRSIAVPALTLLCVIAACVGSIADPQSERRGEAFLTNVIVNGDDTIGVAFMTTLRLSQRASEEEPVVDLVGRRVAAIQINGLSDDVRERLELPVRIGDRVTTDTEQQVERSVHGVSRALRADIVPLPNGQAAVMIATDTPRAWTTRK